MSSCVVLPSEFNINNISFSVPKKNSQGGQSVLVSYHNEATGKNGPLLIQTPKCKMPFGADMSDGDNKVRKYSVNISLASKESTNEYLSKFTEIIRSIDKKAKKFVRSEEGLQWFGKIHSEDMINEMYKLQKS